MGLRGWVRSKLKPRFKIFSVLFFKKGFPYVLLQAENIRSARCSRVVISKFASCSQCKDQLSQHDRCKNLNQRHLRYARRFKSTNQRIATVGSSKPQNPAPHGDVCLVAIRLHALSHFFAHSFAVAARLRRENSE